MSGDMGEGEGMESVGDMRPVEGESCSSKA